MRAGIVPVIVPVFAGGFDAMPIESKYSCGALIELEETAETLMTLDPTNMSCSWRVQGREEELIAFASMRAFRDDNAQGIE